MHQIRGRVGRSSTQAYAYFLYPKNGSMTQTAIERLSSIKQHSALGSGFQLAKKDLEIRGAGNLLGVEQSGQIEGVGFDLFMKMLSEEINRLKKSAQKSRIATDDTSHPTVTDTFDSTAADTETASETSVQPLHRITQIAIPREYISNDVLRLEMYQKLSNSHTRDELQNVLEEMTDRYGPLPPEFSLD
jgi:transcription-repair coupling factor (superfamily II helicase)